MLPVAQMDQHLPRLAPLLHLVAQVLEHLILAANDLALDRTCQFRPVTLLARRRRRLSLGSVGVAEQGLHQFFGGAHVAIDRIDRPDARHLFLVGLLALLAVRPHRLLCDGPDHGDALVVFRDHQQRAFLGLLNRRLLRAEGGGRFGHLLIGVFQGVHRLLQPQDGTEGIAGLAEGVLDAQQLVPLLEQIRQLTLGQLQTLIGGGQFDLLAFPTGVDPAEQGEGAEDGEQVASVLLVEATDGAAVLQGDAVAFVAGAGEGQEGAEEQGAQVEELVEEGAFDLVGGSAVEGSLVQGLDEGLEVAVDLGQQPLDRAARRGLELLRVVCQHGESLLCGIRGPGTPRIFHQGGAFVSPSSPDPISYPGRGERCRSHPFEYNRRCSGRVARRRASPFGGRCRGCRWRQQRLSNQAARS